MNTQENNKMIAEFMVRDKKIDFYTTEETKEGFREEITWYALDGWVRDAELQYHKEWNWLMPVVKKCWKIINELDMSFDKVIFKYRFDYILYADLKESYEAIVEFINEYNKNK
jgi:hypothetical protein